MNESPQPVVSRACTRTGEMRWMSSPSMTTEPSPPSVTTA